MASPSDGVEPSPEPAGLFPTTHWSVVVSAGNIQSLASREALEQLCGAYWYPLYAFVRRRGCGVEEAKDLTQGFFERLLERGFLETATRDRGPRARRDYRLTPAGRHVLDFIRTQLRELCDEVLPEPQRRSRASSPRRRQAR